MASEHASAELLGAMSKLLTSVRDITLRLEVDDVDVARGTQAKVADQLSDYVLPRLVQLDAPLLAVVGGSTGAGKSTLVNSLVGERVTESGVLRPTTRSPVLVHHPDDAEWFLPDRILPDLPRTNVPTNDTYALRLATSDEDPARSRDPRRARRRLDRPGQPRARRPAPRRRRPVALRHVRRALRRPGAVGLPAPGGRAQHVGRRGPRPHDIRSRHRGAWSPRADDDVARPVGLATVHGSGVRSRRRRACCRVRRSRRSWSGCTSSPLIRPPARW